MLYRVPAELDFLLPSYPVDNSPHARPWRGELYWSGIHNAPGDADTKIAFVHAVETEGDIRSDLWPECLSFRVSRPGFNLPEIHAWVQRVTPPLCMFMPGQHRDESVTRPNQQSFRSFVKALRDSKVVAISRWHGPGRVPGSGIILFPVEASNSLIAAAVFHSTPIPDFSSTSLPSQELSHPAPMLMRSFNPAPPRSFEPSQSESYSTEVLSPTSPPFQGAIADLQPWSTLVAAQRAGPSYATPRSHYLHQPNLSQLANSSPSNSMPSGLSGYSLQPTAPSLRRPSASLPSANLNPGVNMWYSPSSMEGLGGNQASQNIRSKYTTH